MNYLHRLVSVYELVVSPFGYEKPIRLEVFESSEKIGFFRARVWIRNTYNLYPTEINTGKAGEDIHSLHTCDDLNHEITLLLDAGETLLRGEQFHNEKEFLDLLLAQIGKYVEALSDT